MSVYLDNSATTALSEAAKEKIKEAIENYGNPSSLHTMGLNAEKLVFEARKNILSALNAKNTGNIVFTSCGTEATSLALFGSAFAKERRDARRILTTNSEHPSVELALQRLEKQGFEVIRLSTENGEIDLDELNSYLDEKIFLATFMMVNNETGALYDVEKAFSLIKAKYPSAITHCDAVQGFLKKRFSPAKIHADLVSISGHKVHAPKGVGALYISKEMIKLKNIIPFLVGGGQEWGMRSGTENVIGISAFGGAVKDTYSKLDKVISAMEETRNYALEKLKNLDVKVNMPVKAAPHIISITLPRIKSETMLHFLSAKDIFISSGSACSSHSNHPSSSLTSFGLSAQKADCTVRVSLCEYNTKEDIDALCTALDEGIKTLIKI